jgi:hypothetical protein
MSMIHQTLRRLRTGSRSNPNPRASGPPSTVKALTPSLAALASRSKDLIQRGVAETEAAEAVVVAPGDVAGAAMQSRTTLLDLGKTTF